jgi:hypothetical protein
MGVNGTRLHESGYRPTSNGFDGILAFILY